MSSLCLTTRSAALRIPRYLGIEKSPKMQQIPPARPVTDEDRVPNTRPITDALGDLIFGNPGLFQDRPGFIAGPPSGNPFQDTVRGLTQLNCRIWASRDKSNYRPAVNAGNAALCGPYLDTLGENPGPGEVGPQFEGGQCAVRYSANLKVTLGSEANPFDQNFAIVCNGPITGASIQTEEGGNTTIGVSCRGATQGSCANAFPDLEPAGFKGIATQTVGANARDLVLSAITRCDGQSDDCGNPPPVITQPPTIIPVFPPSPNITVTPPGYGPVNVNVDLDPEGQPVICFEDFDTCITVTPPGDGGGGDPPPPGPGDTTNPGSPGDGGDTGSGGAADGEAEEGEELVGVLVEILSTPENPNVYANNSAEVFRGIGYVRMGYPGRLGVDTSASAVLGTQFFHAQQRGLTAWEVRANIGYNLRSTPYYREITS